MRCEMHDEGEGRNETHSRCADGRIPSSQPKRDLFDRSRAFSLDSLLRQMSNDGRSRRLRSLGRWKILVDRRST